MFTSAKSWLDSGGSESDILSMDYGSVSESEINVTVRKSEISGVKKPKNYILWSVSLSAFVIVAFCLSKLTHEKTTQFLSFKEKESISTDTTTQSFKFTLARSGYEGLKYFTAKSLILNYKVLKEYDAIIEPYADNYLVIIDDRGLSADYYKYTVCKSGNNGKLTDLA